MNKYLKLDPKASDLTMIRVKIPFREGLKGPNGLSLQRYPKNCGKLVKDKTDQYSWFSAKPIKVGNLTNILAGTEL